jgi:hypothetical protein
MRRTLWVAAGLLLVAIVLPAGAAALSRKQADAIALRVLKPQSGKGNVILFGLPAPVRAGSRVAPADPPKGKPGRTVRTRVPRLRHAAWLYWLDQAPYAMFSHPSRYLLVDDANGRVVKQAGIRWYPAVNGQRPAFVTPKGYASPRYRVFARVVRRTASVEPLPVSFSWPLATIPPGALNGECVLIVSDWSDPAFINDYDGFSDWSRSLKIPTFFATGDGPDKIIPGSKAKPADGDSLASTVTQIQKQGCKDIVLYMSGHGVAPDEGPATVTTRVETVETELGEEKKATGITAADVATIVSQNPSTGFKLKIDACFAGRFEDELSEPDGNGGRKAAFKNLLIVEASSSATSVSTFAIPLLDGNDNPNNLAEFTNQNLTGLAKFFDSDQEIATATAAGGSLMAHALDRAFDLGAPVNHAVDPAGNPIRPEKLTNFGPEAPVLKPIHAVFVPSTFTTTYTEIATGDGLQYQWSIAMSADSDCAKGFKPNTPLQNQAQWYHADVSQGGPCNHLGKSVGPRGHPGTVSLVVSNADWTCTATYVGSEGDNGNPIGDGAPPPACTRR